MLGKEATATFRFSDPGVFTADMDGAYYFLCPRRGHRRVSSVSCGASDDFADGIHERDTQ